MNDDPPDSKRTGLYFALAQVGLEMAAPIGAGAALDYWMDWGPWATVVGAFAGLGLGFWHIIAITQRLNDN